MDRVYFNPKQDKDEHYNDLLSQSKKSTIPSPFSLRVEKNLSFYFQTFVRILRKYTMGRSRLIKIERNVHFPYVVFTRGKLLFLFEEKEIRNL